MKEIYKVKIEEFCTQNIQKLNELLHLEENDLEELEEVQKRIKTEFPDLYDATMMKELLDSEEGDIKDIDLRINGCSDVVKLERILINEPDHVRSHYCNEPTSNFLINALLFFFLGFWLLKQYRVLN